MIVVGKYGTDIMAFWWNITSFVKAGPMADLVASRTGVAHAGQLKREMLQTPPSPHASTDVLKLAVLNRPDHTEPIARCKAGIGLNRSNSGFRCRTKHLYNQNPTSTYCLTGSRYVWACTTSNEKEPEGGGKWSRLEKKQFQ